MGNCVSPQSKTLDGCSPVYVSAVPECPLCHQRAPAPLGQLPLAQREGWVAVGGQLQHRRCQVAAVLGSAQYRRERASYAKAKRAVYPPSCSQCKHGMLGALGMLGVEEEAATIYEDNEVEGDENEGGSWKGRQAEPCQAYREVNRSREAAQDAEACKAAAAGPSTPRAATAATPARRISIDIESMDAGCPATATAKPAASGASSGGGTGSSMPLCNSPADSGMQLGVVGASGNGAGASAALRRPTPIRLPALLEAKMRRKAAVRPNFDHQALESNPEGDNGKAWRQQQEEEIQARMEAELRRQAMIE